MNAHTLTKYMCIHFVAFHFPFILSHSVWFSSSLLSLFSMFFMQKDVRDSLDVVDRSVETIKRDDITKDGPRKQPKPADLTKTTKTHQEQCICEICTCG